MNFIERQVQYPGKKRLVKVDANNIPIIGEPPIFVNLERDEGAVVTAGTPINAQNLNTITADIMNNVEVLLNDKISVVEKAGSPTNGTGYIQFNNGLLINWGFISNTSGLGNYTATITKSYGHTNWNPIVEQYSTTTGRIGADDNFFVQGVNGVNSFGYRKDSNCMGIYYVTFGYVS